MAEDTSQDQAETTDAAQEGNAAPEAPTPGDAAAMETDASPSEAEPTAPAPAPEPAAAAESEETEESGGLDPQLIVLCVVLWFAALGLVIYKWDGLRADWYLGNIMEAINLRNDFDSEAMDQLAAMGPSVVPHLRDEVAGDNFNRDELYRIAVVKVLERIPGQEALETLRLTASDQDPRVRANTYISLRQRVENDPSERAPVVSLLDQAAQMEPELVARAYAIKMLVQLKAMQTLDPVKLSWPFIFGLRAAREQEGLSLYQRQTCLEVLRKLSGKSEQELPFDVSADVDTRDQQEQAWEAWYTSAGGEIPEGQDFASWKAALDAAQAAQDAKAAQDGAAQPKQDDQPAPGDANTTPQPTDEQGSQ